MRRSRKPLSKRQQRKVEARAAMALAETEKEKRQAAFRPILWNMHKHGQRHYRRHMSAVNRGCVGDFWRVRKQWRGEYYGRKLERLIRSGAPFAEVRAERKIIQALLAA